MGSGGSLGSFITHAAASILLLERIRVLVASRTRSSAGGANFLVPARGRFPLAVGLSRTAVLQSCCRKTAIQERRDTELPDWLENGEHE